MAYMWSSGSLSLYMFVFYLKYLPGDIFTNTITNSATDMFSNIVAAFLYSKTGAKLAYTILLTLAVAGGCLIIFFGEE